MVFKLDFEKVYDRASWGFLDFVYEKSVLEISGNIGSKGAYPRIFLEFGE